MRLLLPLILFGILQAAPKSLRTDEEVKAPKPTAHISREIEGWTVRMDTRLRELPNAELGHRAEALLRSSLANIAAVMPAPALEKLRTVRIWLDLDHGSLTSMQYHPSAGWLTQHGFDPALVKGVHIPFAQRFVSPQHQHVQPWCVLHELAHAFHDQVLGFDHADVVKAWETYTASKRGDRALHVNGRKVRHYALTNPKEFFAEMTEAYFGTNDFYPFVHGELLNAEPQIHALLRGIWGIAPIDAGS